MLNFDGRTPIAAFCGALMLAACATQAPSPPSVSVETVDSAASLLAPLSVPVATLSADDPGIQTLAKKLEGTAQVSFASGWERYQEDQRLKSALTEALIGSGAAGLLLLNVPCEGAGILDQYASGAATSDLAADVVRAAPLPDSQKTEALADVLTVARGWNAVNLDRPLKISGVHCDAAASAESNRTVIFWGMEQLASQESEKAVAAEARTPGVPARPHVWLAQASGSALSDIIPASGWLDLRDLPAKPAIAAWRAEKGLEVPALLGEKSWSADIVFRHTASTPAVPF
ncbi:hypothetical protein K1X12_00305 [Hyphomonas sp. WL0036]|uniref:hypothetical protein n=1 Tax=Hyphomonas sediminis TaxID=2866160 RepID=UPI001C80C5CC|nr:hypothetical protein [Hyphomonas sediminis]MBY9065316.1 hypothetical protein [Hyphomonas sediminis]